MQIWIKSAFVDVSIALCLRSKGLNLDDLSLLSSKLPGLQSNISWKLMRNCLVYNRIYDRNPSPVQASVPEGLLPLSC